MMGKEVKKMATLCKGLNLYQLVGNTNLPEASINPRLTNALPEALD